MMDERYFEEKLLVVKYKQVFSEVLTILKQIAHDAKVEQARVDREAVEKMKLDKDATSGYVRGVYAASAALDTVAPKEEK